MLVFKKYNGPIAADDIGFKVLFVTYSIIQNIISSEMYIRTGPLSGYAKYVTHNTRIYINIGEKK